MPQRGVDDVLIRVTACSVSRLIKKIREGHLKAMLPFTMPFISGWDVSGMVHVIGKNVLRFQVGDAVFFRPYFTRDGTFAEFVAVRDNEVAAKPRTISHIWAAGLPLAGITA